ncbi:hypothetical protein EQZ23_00205 [Sphingomonas sp. UV9]|uniref:hypothetical protein n=1 Tax=Sphingomonas sp. UV9 TaxID=1851410 RepID=UPI000FFC52C7|nr:hypothetical protein [Sphingomonas sp. UV9]RXD06595.1 hypothetical protein EQZ23_00205 [Sphingomonas sp. UV9]
MTGVLGLLDLMIAGAPVLIFCVWQLVSLNRAIARDKVGRDSPTSPDPAIPEGASPEGASPEGAGHPVG